jgi:hypothetical protein
MDWSVLPIDFHAAMSEQNFVSLGSDVIGHRELTIVSREFGDFETVVHVVYDDDSKRYLAESLTARRAGSPGEITATELRKIRVEELMRAAIPSTLMFEYEEDEFGGHSGVKNVMGLVPSYVLEEIHKTGLSDNSLMWASRIYSISRAFRLPPTKSVSEILEIPIRTASNWIARAKSQGLIES